MPFEENMLQKTRELIERNRGVPAELQQAEWQNVNAELRNVEDIKQENDFINRALFEDMTDVKLTDSERNRLLNIHSRNSSHILLNDDKFTGDSDSMKRVKEYIGKLEDALSSEGNMQDDADQLFDRAINACQYYLDTHNPRFKTGKERKLMVKERLDSLKQERKFYEKGRQAYLAGFEKEVSRPLDLIDIGRNKRVAVQKEKPEIVIPEGEFKWDDAANIEVLKKPQFVNLTQPLSKYKFGKKFKDRYDNKQRTQQRLKKGTELYKKDQRANTLLGIDKKKKDISLAKIKGMGLPDETINAKEIEMCSAFAKNGDELAEMVRRLNSDSMYLKQEAFAKIVKTVLECDVKDLDFKDDDSFVQSANRLADISELARAAEYLKFRYKEIFDTMPKELQDKFELQRINITKLGAYYELKKSILTDDYYRDHEDSEISLRADEKAAKAQRNLVFKMYVWDGFVDLHQFVPGREHKVPKFATKPVKQYLRDPAVDKFKSLTIGEFNKTAFSYKGTVHEEFFARLSDENAPEELRKKYKRLMAGHYQVLGEKTANKEKLFRSIGIMANLEAVQEMSTEELETLVDDLTAVPENDTEDALKEANSRNRKGLLKLKDIAYKQMRYLDEKYGHNAIFDAPDTAAENDVQRAKDWVWLCDVTSGLIPYLDDLGLLDHKSEADTELVNLARKQTGEYFSLGSNTFNDTAALEDNNVYDMGVLLTAMARSYACTIDKWAIKNQNFIYATVDQITGKIGDTEVHHNAKHRSGRNLTDKTTVKKYLALEERKKERAAAKDEIEKLINNRLDIVSGSNSDSPEMNAVKNAYKGLVKTLDQIPYSDQMVDQKKAISDAYNKLIKACNDYKNGKQPSSADGKARLRKVEWLHEHMKAELDEFELVSGNVRFEDYKSFNEMLDLNDPKLIENGEH